MVVPHVINPVGLPQGFVETTHYAEVKNIPIQASGWTFITDAMSRVLLPEGTAPSAHVAGVDIAGKTGSAQIVSLALGFTPRRNPDIIVCVLFEGGEHGKLAARLATQVIKAFVDKQRRQPTKVAGSGNGKVEIGGIWTDPSSAEKPSDDLQAGRFVVDVARKKVPLAMAAPGMQ